MSNLKSRVDSLNEQYEGVFFTLTSFFIYDLNTFSMFKLTVNIPQQKLKFEYTSVETDFDEIYRQVKNVLSFLGVEPIKNKAESNVDTIR